MLVTFLRLDYMFSQQTEKQIQVISRLNTHRNVHKSPLRGFHSQVVTEFHVFFVCSKRGKS